MSEIFDSGPGFAMEIQQDSLVVNASRLIGREVQYLLNKYNLQPTHQETAELGRAVREVLASYDAVRIMEAEQLKRSLADARNVQTVTGTLPLQWPDNLCPRCIMSANNAGVLEHADYCPARSVGSVRIFGSYFPATQHAADEKCASCGLAYHAAHSIGMTNDHPFTSAVTPK